MLNSLPIKKRLKINQSNELNSKYNWLSPENNIYKCFSVSGIDLLIKPTEQNLTDNEYYNWVELSNLVWDIYEKNNKLDELISLLNDNNLFLFSRIINKNDLIIRKRFDQHDGKGRDPGVQGYLIFYGYIPI